MACATVKAKNAAFVTLLVFDTHEEKVPSEDTLFRVEMSDGEFRRTYQKEAEQLIANIQVKVPVYAIGTHETWNTWLSHDPYEMAAECKKNKIQVLGHCTDILPKRSLLDPALILDVGICAEFGNGEKIWCHWSSGALKQMLASWKTRAEREDGNSQK
jgi:hypothetical protein|nr:hypothetical protein [uncultured Oscillibacter sp.]